MDTSQCTGRGRRARQRPGRGAARLGLVAGLALAVTLAPPVGPAVAGPDAAPPPDPVVRAAGAGVAAVAFDGEPGTLTGVSASANASVSAAAARNGNGGLLVSSAAAPGYVRWGPDVVPQGHTHASVRLWVRVLDHGPDESVDLVTIGNDQQTRNFDFFVSRLTGRFQWDLFWGDTDESDFVVELDRWYLVEAQVEFAGSVHTAEVRIDGVPQGTIATDGSGMTVRMLSVGFQGDKTHIQHYDDIALRLGAQPLGWIDTTPPEVSITTPADGAVYGIGEVVAADYVCSDDAGAVATCSGSVAPGEPIETGTAGDHSVTVTAVDGAGLTTTVTHTYAVADARPDARIRRGRAGRLMGDDVYNRNGWHQTRTGSTRRGHRIVHPVSLQNDAPFADRLLVRGPASTRHFTVRFRDPAGRDVTRRVSAGTYRTPQLPPGAVHTVRAVVTVGKQAPHNARLARAVTVRSQADPTVRDTVRFVTRRR